MYYVILCVITIAFPCRQGFSPLWERIQISISSTLLFNTVLYVGLNNNNHYPFGLRNAQLRYVPSPSLLCSQILAGYWLATVAAPLGLLHLSRARNSPWHRNSCWGKPNVTQIAPSQYRIPLFWRKRNRTKEHNVNYCTSLSLIQ